MIETPRVLHFSAFIANVTMERRAKIAIELHEGEKPTKKICR